MKRFTGQGLYKVFRANTADIYPGRYTLEYCERLPDMANEPLELLSQKHVLLLLNLA